MHASVHTSSVVLRLVFEACRFVLLSAVLGIRSATSSVGSQCRLLHQRALQALPETRYQAAMRHAADR